MSDLTLVIANKNYSSWSLRAWLYMKAFDIPFEEIKIYLDIEGYKEKILKYSPSGKVPCLIDKDATVWDSLAICEYLAEKYPDKNGWPTDPKTRAVARSVSAEMHSGFMDLRSTMPMSCRNRVKNFKPSNGAQKDIDRIKNIWNTCRNQYASNGPWLFGNFSIADCMYAPVVMRFQTYQVPLNELEKSYMQTVIEHPAMMEWYKAAEEETEVIQEAEL